MTGNHVLSIAVCCWEITQGIERALKSMELPLLACHNPITLSVFAAALNPSSLSFRSFSEVNPLLLSLPTLLRSSEPNLKRRIQA